MKQTAWGCALGLIMAMASASYAMEKTPVGLWKTIDDHTGVPRGLVRITESNGEYQARVEKFSPKAGEDVNPKCEKCEGARRNQPVIGMTVRGDL